MSSSDVFQWDRNPVQLIKTTCDSNILECTRNSVKCIFIKMSFLPRKSVNLAANRTFSSDSGHLVIDNISSKRIVRFFSLIGKSWKNIRSVELLSSGGNQIRKTVSLEILYIFRPLQLLKKLTFVVTILNFFYLSGFKILSLPCVTHSMIIQQDELLSNYLPSKN